MTFKRWPYDFRDVSVGLRLLRDFLQGRQHVLHGRFMPQISARSIPPPDIPRGPEYKYANQYYTRRSAYDSVKPPVIAPVAQGPPPNKDPTKDAQVGGVKPDSVAFPSLPTPGTSFWWDGHCYYECVDVKPCGPQRTRKPPPEPKRQCAANEKTSNKTDTACDPCKGP